MDFSDEFAILKEMQEDLKEHFEREYEGEAQLGNSEAEDKRKFSSDSLVSETSLQEHLLDQLKLVDCNDGIREAAQYIIGSLNENGFLAGTLSDMALVSGLPLQDLQDSLSLLQTFDPVGIAALDLRTAFLNKWNPAGGKIPSPIKSCRITFNYLCEEGCPNLPGSFPNPPK